MIAIKKVGERVKHLREEKNYSQQYFADKLGITQKAYSKIESGETRFSVDHLLKVAEILETPIEDILPAEGNAVYNNFNTHNGEGIVIHKGASDKLEELYEKTLKSKDEEISRLAAQNIALLKTIDELTKKL